MLPQYGVIPEDDYIAKVELIAACDEAGMSGQRIRRALAAGGGGKMVKLYAYEVGLPSTATEAEIVAAWRTLGAEKKRLMAENAQLRTRLGQTGDAGYDRVVRKHRELFGAGEAKAAATGVDRARLKAAVLSELTERVSAARAAEPALTDAQAASKIFREDPEFYRRVERGRRGEAAS